MPTHLISPLVALGFVVCWSSGFVGGRLALESTLPVFTLFAWRFLLAGSMTGVWWYISAPVLFNRRELVQEVGVGSLTMGGYLLGVILAIQLGVSAGVTALIAALQPLLAAALAGPWLGEKLSRLGWAGMAVAAGGVVLCVLDDVGKGGDVPLWAYALPLLSVVSVTLGSLVSVNRRAALPMAPTLTMQLLAATLVFSVAALIDGGGEIQWLTTEPVTLSAIAWLIVLSSLGGYGFFVTSLRRLGVTTTSTLVYLTPPVTLVWAALMFGETPGPNGMLGMGVAIAGVALAMLCGRGRHQESDSILPRYAGHAGGV
ncbi:DMT family transporter [Saccharospirillum alexandrii]|uniref:DMT family transporter n=1 Tax=Saccharospirillum alexandrii TaxID=2448477 RepID=UPI000FD859E1|nr:DMT family transporter [Saccharospirillum alexandrii]